MHTLTQVGTCLFNGLKRQSLQVTNASWMKRKRNSIKWLYFYYAFSKAEVIGNSLNPRLHVSIFLDYKLGESHHDEIREPFS